MKRCPKCNLKYDDSLSFCLEDGARLLRGNDPEKTQVLPHPELRATIAVVPVHAPTLGGEPITIDDPVVVINIHEQYPHAHNNPEYLYNATRGLWRMDRSRARRAKYFFAVYMGEIKEVYEVHDCIPATKETSAFWRNIERQQGRIQRPHEGRSEFIGALADDTVRRKYIGRRVPVRLGQNPVRYFNC